MIYKYAGCNGALKILENCSLRFSRPSALNDPFDVFIDDLYNAPIEGVMEQSKDQLVDLLVKDPDAFAKFVEVDPDEARNVAKILEPLTGEARKKISDAFSLALLASVDQALCDSSKQLRSERDKLVNDFKNSGVFCATHTNDNLLMWAHYAEHHRGVVLGFAPDVERDSFLRLLESVKYTDQRPRFYDKMLQLGPDHPELTPEEAKSLQRDMLFSKSEHWRYEEELRIVIPGEVKEGQDASYLKFYPHELKDIFIGCRAPIEFKQQVTAAAMGLNPNVRIFEAALDSKRFALLFRQLA